MKVNTLTNEQAQNAQAAVGFQNRTMTNGNTVTGATATAEAGTITNKRKGLKVETKAARIDTRKAGSKKAARKADKATADKAEYVQYTSEAGKALIRAFLFNMRNSNKDVRTSAAAGYSEIVKGSLYIGKYGVCVAMETCKGLFARKVTFKANGKAERNGVKVDCMHVNGLNYAVGKFNGNLGNIELDRFAGQTKKNRFALVG